MMQIRARTRADLEELLGASEVEAHILDIPRADYRYRIIVTRNDMVRLVAGMAEESATRILKERWQQAPRKLTRNRTFIECGPSRGSGRMMRRAR